MTITPPAPANPPPSSPLPLHSNDRNDPSSPTAAIPILLLKTRSHPTDTYETYFTNTSTLSFTPHFIPVLHHTYSTTALSHVRSLLLSPSTLLTQYGGLIFTSQRAVEAFGSVLEDLPTNPSTEPAEEATPTPTPRLQDLSLPLYTVGPATSRALSALQSTHLPLSHIHGQDTGNGENLAHFILSHYPSLPSSQLPNQQNDNTNTSSSSSSSPLLPLLFLVGETRRDIIPRTLSAHGIRVEELPVYETTIQDAFPAAFAAVLEETRDARAVWVVVFSPAGCGSMLRVLGWMDGEEGGTGRVRVREGVMEERGDGRRVFVASIGPTTRDYLREEFGCVADICAERPSPEGLGEGIAEFMTGRGMFG